MRASPPSHPKRCPQTIYNHLQTTKSILKSLPDRLQIIHNPFPNHHQASPHPSPTTSKRSANYRETNPKVRWAEKGFYTIQNQRCCPSELTARSGCREAPCLWFVSQPLAPRAIDLNKNATTESEAAARVDCHQVMGMRGRGWQPNRQGMS